MEGFRGTFHVKGAQKVGEVFVPIGMTDFAPYLSQIKQAEPDLVMPPALVPTRCASSSYSPPSASVPR